MFKNNKPLFGFLILQLICIASGFYVNPINNEKVISVITFLFLIVNPFLYFLLNRNKNTEFTFLFVFYSTFKLAPYVIPMHENFFKFIFDWKIYFNLAFLIYLAWNAVQFFLLFKKNINQESEGSKDDYTVIVNSLQKSIRFKRLGELIAFEVCSFYYCFVKWSGNQKSDNQFTGFKNSGVGAIYIGLMLVSVIEGVGMHLFLITRYKNIAFIFLILHIYMLINLIGHLKAILFRRHQIASQQMIIRYGLFETLAIAISSIKTIKKFEGDYDKSNSLLKYALLGNLEPHNVYIELKNEIQVNLPFGIQKEPKKILLYIDNVDDFIHNVTICLNNSN
jgi:hypothetical protein